jgi:pyruvate dehydrogenase phosphatase
MPPEYIQRREITSKHDIFSLGVIIVRIVAGEEGYSKCSCMSSQEFLEHVCKISCIINKNPLFINIISMSCLTLHAIFRHYVPTLQVQENWGKRLRETMASHASEQVNTCIEIALRCVEVDREKRPTIAEIVDELNKVDTVERSPTGQVYIYLYLDRL